MISSSIIKRHADSHVYGAIAGLSFVEDSDRYAHRRGLFIVGVVGEGIVEIRNAASFRPKDFGRRSDRSATDRAAEDTDEFD